MKRGFLVKAAGKNKSLANKRADKELQPSKPKDDNALPQDTRRKIQVPASGLEDLPKYRIPYRLPYCNLTEREKAFPDDYDKNDAILAASRAICKAIPHIDDGDGITQWIIGDEYAEKKLLSTPGYPARKPKPERPDLYEVRTTEKMGQGVFAKHAIKRGGVIFSERPLLVAYNWMNNTETKNQYTFEQSQQIMMFEKEKVLEVAFQRMNESDKADFMALYNGHTNDGSGPLLGIMRTNAFAAEGLLDGKSVLRYSAVCKIASRLNHRCRPNVLMVFEISSFSYKFIAAQDIQAGEELYYSYISLARTKAERQTDLQPYGFSCNCLACINATPATDEMRKTFEGQPEILEAMSNQPELIADVLASAKVLEDKMVAEGLDVTSSFFSLLLVIFLTCEKLGRAETWKYHERVQEYARIYVHYIQPDASG